jgi:hypothetical protein
VKASPTVMATIMRPTTPHAAPENEIKLFSHKVYANEFNTYYK